MKANALVCLCTLALLALFGCGKGQSRQNYNVEFVLELSPPDWLLRNAARPMGSSAQGLVAELGKETQMSTDHATDVLERLVTRHGYADSLALWFPDLVRSSGQSGTPMVQLKRVFDLGIVSVERAVTRRTQDEAQVVVDEYGRIHVHAHADDGGQRLQRLLTAQGQLGFYETLNYHEMIEAMRSLRERTYEIENGDTTFDLFLLNVDGKDMYGDFDQDLGIIADRPAIFFAHARDTARIMRTFRSDLAQQILPSQSAFAWALPPSKDHPDVFPLIALKTTPEGKPRLDGSHVVQARQDFMDGGTGAIVNIEMDESGAAEWARLTRSNLRRCVAIVFDGVVRSYPTVQTEITGGRSQITGDFTVEEAKDLANTLQGGAYPAKVNIVEMKQISSGR